MACNHNCSECGENCNHKHTSLLEQPNRYSSVKKIIAVMSGKGGVGKSMVTGLLASLMNKRGYKTGVLDADITGPSIPRMFGVHQKGEGSSEGLLPAETKNHIKIMSSHLLLEHETDPIIWRGSLISSLVRQFWKDVIWEDVDYLFVDMPPGTGDVPLTVFQSIGIDGIIVVASPQELVKMIVEKAVKMANMMNIPIIGLVENMSYVECGKCGEHIEVFGPSHIDEISKEYNVPVLAKMPIDHNLSVLSDKGEIEEANVNYLDSALDVLENLPLKLYNIAVPVKAGNIDEVFENAREFYIYSTTHSMIIGGKKVKINDIEEIYNSMKKNGVMTIICDRIDPQLCRTFEEDGFEVYVDSKGNPADAVKDYLALEFAQTHECDGNCSECSEECSNREHECDGNCEECGESCEHRH